MAKFRNTRTGAIRESTTALGYPFVPYKAPAAAKADDDDATAKKSTDVADRLAAAPAKKAPAKRAAKKKG